MGKSVLYIGAGNPLSPGSGMDVVLREHILELIQLTDMKLTGITVQPGVSGATYSQPVLPWKNFNHFVGDLQHEAGGLSRVFKKLWLILFSAASLSAYAFCSKAARQHIAAELKNGHDVIVIDHVLSICNIPFWQLLFSHSNIILIAHDVMPFYLLETARLQANPLKKLFLMMEALKAWVVEVLLINKSAMTVFLSQWDLRQYQWMPSYRAMSLCPMLTQRQALNKYPNNPVREVAKPEVVFIGSPGFLPNKAALQWIIDYLSPSLLAIDPDISIVLVGKGTAALDAQHRPNIKHMGFVSDEDLAALLRDCLAVISPVVHGSGIKIKVLEAVIAGSPVLATAESLRGFEFLDVQPMIELDNPDIAARAIVQLKQMPEEQAKARHHISRQWEKYMQEHHSKLGSVILRLLDNNKDSSQGAR